VRDKTFVDEALHYLQEKNAYAASLEPEPKKLLWIIFATSIVFSTVTVFTEFLTAEDASVLFNRFNGISDATVLFYYQGYISFHPQLLAWSFSALPAVLQPLMYASVAAVIWLLLIAIAHRCWNAAIAVGLLGLYFFRYDPIYFANLTYTIWPSILILALIGGGAVLNERPLPWRIFCIALILCFASPLSICAVPVLAVSAFMRRDAKLIVLTAATIFAFFILRESGDQARGGTMSTMATNLLTNLPVFFSSITNGRGLSGLNLPSVVRLGSLVLSMAAAIYYIPSFIEYMRNKSTSRKENAAIFLLAIFALATLIAFAASKQGDAFIRGGTRYYFPAIACSALILFHILRQMKLERLLIVTGMTVLLPLALLTLVQSVPAIGRGAEMWKQVASSPRADISKIDVGEGIKEDLIYVGPPVFQMADCTEKSPPFSNLIIFCGHQSWIFPREALQRKRTP